MKAIESAMAVEIGSVLVTRPAIEFVQVKLVQICRELVSKIYVE